MAGKITGISDLDASKNDWAIVARVIRLWSAHAGDSSRSTTSIEMILADVEGVEIHAIVRKLFLKKFERVLKEGSVYLLRNISVVNNGGEYKLTRHGYKVNFQGNTKVSLMPDSMVPLPACVFTHFSEILGGLLDASYLIDIIGVLTGVGDERTVEKGSRSIKMNVIELENDGYRVKRLTKVADIINTFKALVVDNNLETGSASADCSTFSSRATHTSDLVPDCAPDSFGKDTFPDPVKGKSISIPSKRNLVDVVEEAKEGCTPKLLRSIKLEKP